MRRAAIAMLVLGLGRAPLQCPRDPDPNLRREDTAGDALWNLAAYFHEHHDDASAKATLQYLVDRYPSSRHAEAARLELLAPDAGE